MAGLDGRDVTGALVSGDPLSAMLRSIFGNAFEGVFGGQGKDFMSDKGFSEQFKSWQDAYNAAGQGRADIEATGLNPDWGKPVGLWQPTPHSSAIQIFQDQQGLYYNMEPSGDVIRLNSLPTTGKVKMDQGWKAPQAGGAQSVAQQTGGQVQGNMDLSPNIAMLQSLGIDITKIPGLQGYQAGGPQNRPRWLPDGSLDMGNGMIWMPNGRIMQNGVELSVQESAQVSPSTINDAMAQAGPRPDPSVVPGAGQMGLPVFGGEGTDYTKAIMDLLAGLGLPKPSGDSVPLPASSGQVPAATTPVTTPAQTPVTSASTPVTTTPQPPVNTSPPATTPASTTPPGTVTTSGQVSTPKPGESGVNTDLISILLGGLGGSKPSDTTKDTGANMGTLSDIFDAVTGGMSGITDYLGKLDAGKVFSTAAGGAATIYNINQQKEAAEKMAGALDRATGVQKEMFDLTRQDLAPYRLSPQGAASAAGFQAPGGLPNVPTGAAGNPLDTSRLTDPSSAIYGGAGNLPNPKLAGDMTADLPDFTTYNDPAYEWMRKEGMRAIQNAGAARGRLDSGSTLKQLNEMGVGLAGQQMDKVARMRGQLFGERLGQQQEQFGEVMNLRDQLFGEGVTGSQVRFGQLSDREKAQMGQQLARFEQENLKQQQNYAQALQLRQILFGESLTADEQDFLQKYNLAQMGANASMGAGNAAMQNASNLGSLALGKGQASAIDASSRAGIINDFIKTLFS